MLIRILPGDSYSNWKPGVISAIVKIKTSSTPNDEITDRISAIPGVSDVYPVEGHYNLVAIIDVNDAGCGKKLVETEILPIYGIQSAILTHTL